MLSYSSQYVKEKKKKDKLTIKLAYFLWWHRTNNKRKQEFVQAKKLSH